MPDDKGKEEQPKRLWQQRARQAWEKIKRHRMVTIMLGVFTVVGIVNDGAATLGWLTKILQFLLSRPVALVVIACCLIYLFQDTLRAFLSHFLVSPSTHQTWTAHQTFDKSTELRLRDDGNRIYSSAPGVLNIQGNTSTVIGKLGDFGLGVPNQSTEQFLEPLTDLKWSLGRSTARFKDAWFTRLHIYQSHKKVSSPPTEAELDLAFGTPDALGEGVIGTISSSAGFEVWLCMTFGGKWYYAPMIAVESKREFRLEREDLSD